MGKKLTGTVEFRSNLWQARVTMPDGSRPWIEMPGINNELTARAVAKVMAEQVRQTGQVPTVRGETVNEYVTRWTKWRLASGLTSAAVCESYIETHFAPKYGVIPISAIERPMLEDFVAELDGKAIAEAISPKTAENIWGAVSTMFRDASNAKARELRVIDTNPALGVHGPDKGERKAKQYLYPDEFLALVGCEDVPVTRARIYAAATYTYSRAGELVPLTWHDVDLAHGKIHIHKAVNRCQQPGVIKGTKSNRARRIAIEVELLPMLKAMRAEGGGELLFPDMPRADGEYGLASLFRRDLKAARIERAELFTATRTSKAIVFHDLRATGITWMAVRGDDPLKIQQRAGHSTFSTTQGYIREAEVSRENFGEVFPPLPARIVSSPNRPIVQENSEFLEEFVGAAGIEPAVIAHEIPRKDAKIVETEASNRPNDDVPPGSVAGHLAEALCLAAKAARWDLVATLSTLMENACKQK